MTQLSRVHELGRLARTRLIVIYLDLLAGNYHSVVRKAVAGWDRDKLITAIRNLEEPWTR